MNGIHEVVSSTPIGSTKLDKAEKLHAEVSFGGISGPLVLSRQVKAPRPPISEVPTGEKDSGHPFTRRRIGCPS